MPLAMVRSDGTQAETQGLPAEYQAIKEQYPEQWGTTLDKLPRKIAAAIRQLEQSTSPDKSPVDILYYHTDHLGTPRELTDKDGHIVWSATYKAWGSTANIERPGRLITDIQGNVQIQRWEQQAEPIEQNLRFQGQYFDQEAGLHYNRFRYYDPDCGRFVSQDPIGLWGGKNVYVYGFASTNSVDPYGLMPWKWNPNGMGHHLVYKNKAKCAGIDLLATDKDTPTFFPIPYEPGMHELIHRAQDPFVGGRTGGWAGSAEELLSASKEGLESVAHIKNTTHRSSFG